MTVHKSWFEVDRKGLAKLIERRGKIWLLHELIANAWDADGVAHVEIFLEPEEGRPLVNVVVRDDAPGGFADLRHAWMLFAESTRKSQALKRGRFDIGNKLVLAMCEEASVISTHDAVMFDGRGRAPMRARRSQGTEFFGLARITRAELAEIQTGLQRLIPPPDIVTTINGVKLLSRPPIRTFQATLPTELANEEGVLRRVARRCDVSIHRLQSGETAMLYEMGIPVVEIDSRWHVNIQQKVPLNMERDNVTPAYLRDIYVLTANALCDQLTIEDRRNG